MTKKVQPKKEQSQKVQPNNRPVFRGSVKGYKKFLGKVALWKAEGKKYVYSGYLTILNTKYKIYLFENK